MLAFLRALVDRRGLAPEPDLRWPYQPPAVVDSFRLEPGQVAAIARLMVSSARPWLIAAARDVLAERRRPCA